MADLRPLPNLLGMALAANRRGEKELEAELRSEIALHQLRSHFRKANHPILPQHAEAAHAIVDEAVAK